MKLCNSERSERRADEKVRKWRVQPDQLGRLCHFFEHCHIIDAHSVIFHAFPCFYFTMEGKEEERGLLTFFFTKSPPTFRYPALVRQCVRVWTIISCDHFRRKINKIIWQIRERLERRKLRCAGRLSLSLSPSAVEANRYDPVCVECRWPCGWNEQQHQQLERMTSLNVWYLIFR